MGQFNKFLPGHGLPTSGNRAVGESFVVKKDKPKAAAAGAPPSKPPKDTNKKEPNNENQKRKPDDGLGGLVRNK